MDIIHVTTVPQSLAFVAGQIEYMQRKGLQVAVVSSPSDLLTRTAASLGVQAFPVEMPRRITPFADVCALWKLFFLFRRLRPLIVHAHTPKAGLLATLAAAAAGVQIRVFQVHGLPHIAWKGWRRILLRSCTRVACAFAHRVLCVSQSMRDVIVTEQLCAGAKCFVVHNGSSHGADATGTFEPRKMSGSHRRKLRADWSAGDRATVLGYFGRIVRDKGIHELVDAFKLLLETHCDVHLIIAGSAEPRDSIRPEYLSFLRAHPRVHMLGWVGSTAAIYPAIDVLVLPSYREGYPNVVLEAAAMEKPAIVSSVPGCTDAVLHGETGLQVPVHDARALADAIRIYIDNPELRERHGRRARQRVLTDYRPQDLWDFVFASYQELLGSSQSDARAWTLGHPIQERLKRLIDILASLVTLVILLPLMALVALLVRVRIGSPVLFRQSRIGWKDRVFTFVKFRTMTEMRGPDGQPLPDAFRLTSFGNWLRETSLDELPQLWHVLTGRMSLVGPRPLLLEYLKFYSPSQRRRHTVRPGITGWAQVNGRNDTTWERRFELDVWYVDHHCLALDLKILWTTLRKLMVRDGIRHAGHATMPRFSGDQQEL